MNKWDVTPSKPVAYPLGLLTICDIAMKKHLPTLLFALTTCVFAGLYLNERSQDEAQPDPEPVAKDTKAPKETAKATALTARPTKTPDATEPESDDVMDAFDLALEEIAPASTNVNSQANLASNITSMISSAIGEAFKPDSDMAKMMKDQELLGTMQRVGRNYGTLMQDFGLSYAEQQEFTDLVTAYEQAGRADPMSFLAAAGTNGTFNIDWNGEKMKEMRAQREEAKAAAEDDIKTYLGDERYEDYKYYRKTLGARNKVKEFQQDLADGNLMMNRDQQEKLVNLYDKHGLNQNRRRGGWGGPRGGSPDPVVISSSSNGDGVTSGATISSAQIVVADEGGEIDLTPTDDRTEERLNQRAAQYDAVLNDSEGDLSAEQHQALERHFEHQLRQDEIRAEQQRRWREMFQGGGGLQGLFGNPQGK